MSYIINLLPNASYGILLGNKKPLFNRSDVINNQTTWLLIYFISRFHAHAMCTDKNLDATAIVTILLSPIYE